MIYTDDEEDDLDDPFDSDKASNSEGGGIYGASDIEEATNTRGRGYSTGSHDIIQKKRLKPSGNEEGLATDKAILKETQAKRRARESAEVKEVRKRLKETLWKGTLSQLVFRGSGSSSNSNFKTG